MHLSKKRRAELMALPYTRILAEHEVALAKLYNCLGSVLTPAKDFWRNLAKEELDHRDIVKQIEAKILNEKLDFKMPQYKFADVADSIEWINTIRERMEEEGITMNRALETALYVERSILESDFFEIVEAPNDTIKKMLDNLAKYTERHYKEVEAEAKKIKWKFVGNKTYKVDPLAEKWEPCEDVKAKVTAAQANILELIVSYEEAVGNLYNTYGVLLEEDSDFWFQMSKEEMQHGAMLRKLHDVLDKGHLFQDIGRFKEVDLELEIEEALQAELDARQNGITLHDAVNVALKIEQTMAESKFYTIVDSDSEEFKIIATRLVQLTKGHMDKLHKEVGHLLEKTNHALHNPSQPE